MKKVFALAIGASLWAMTIYPIPIYIKEPMKIKQLNIKEDNSKYQVFVKGDSDLVVYPKIFKAPKSIKILYKGKKPQVEKNYRIVLQELLMDQELKDGKMLIVKRFSIPLFVLPKDIRSKLSYQCFDRGILLKNEGNVHFLINLLNGKKVHWYLYPNQTKEVRDVESVHIKTDKGEYNFTCKEDK